MAPVIWGLDLSEIKWSKFKSSYMWNRDYQRRRTKFVVYQVAMICCVVSESLGTAALSDYVNQQDSLANLEQPALEYNDDFVGIGSYNIFVGIYIATIFGAAFFFDLFWPERRESRSVKLAWRICSVLACVLVVGDVAALTVIVSSSSAYIIGPGAYMAEVVLRQYTHSPLEYRKNGRAIASLVFLWIGFPAVVASTILLWMSISYIDRHGPFSSHRIDQEKLDVRITESEAGTTDRDAENEMRALDGGSLSRGEAVPSIPAPAAVQESINGRRPLEDLSVTMGQFRVPASGRVYPGT